MPSTNKAVYLSKSSGAVVKDRPSAEPDLDDNEILIKNVAVASNPKGASCIRLTILYLDLTTPF
jgi:NADPH:quinone reductase-like Zn-dependent oxidoreductase